MPHDPSPNWIDRRVRAAMRGETDALRLSIGALGSRLEADREARQAELTDVRAEVARLQAAVSEISGIMAGLVASAHEREEHIRTELQSLREEFVAFDQRTDAALAEREGRIEQGSAERDARIEQGLAERDVRIEQGLAERDARIEQGLAERDGRIEAVRLRLEGLMAQYRWDVEQLRQSLAVVAERLPLTE